MFQSHDVDNMEYPEEAVAIEAIREEVSQESVFHQFIRRWRKQCIVCRAAFGLAVSIRVNSVLGVNPYWYDHGFLKFWKAASRDRQHPSIFHLLLVIR